MIANVRKTSIPSADPADSSPRMAGHLLNPPWRKEVGPALLVMGATLAVELGCFGLCRVAGAEFRQALLATLGWACLWTAMAAPAMSAGAGSHLEAVFRGGAVADGTGLSLLWLWLIGLGEPTGLTFVAAVQAYLVFAAVALSAVATVCCGRSAVLRAGLAVLAGAVLVVLLASPVWANALLEDVDGAAAVDIATWAVRVNPFQAVTGTFAERVRFVWHGWGTMYDWSYLGEYVLPRPVPWWQTAGVYAGVAAGLGCLAWLLSVCRSCPSR
jgi:hypothetical protein